MGPEASSLKTEAPLKATATFSKKVRRMLGLDLHGWETVMVGSLIAAGVAALLVAFSTWLVVRLQREALADAEVRINEAKEGAAKANEKAAAIAATNLQLETNLEKERIERLKLEAAVAPRSITPEQSAALTAVWRKFAKKRVLIESYSLDAEAAFLSQEIAKALHLAGVEVVNGSMTVTPSGDFKLGIHSTATSDQELAHGIAMAIGEKANLAVIYHPKPVREQGAQMILGGPDRANVQASIFVGFKPIPGTKERQERVLGR